MPKLTAVVPQFPHLGAIGSEVAPVIADFPAIVAEIPPVTAEFAPVLSDVSAILPEFFRTGPCPQIIAQLPTIVAQIAPILTHLAPILTHFASILTQLLALTWGSPDRRAGLRQRGARKTCHDEERRPAEAQHVPFHCMPLSLRSAPLELVGAVPGTWIAAGYSTSEV